MRFCLSLQIFFENTNSVEFSKHNFLYALLAPATISTHHINVVYKGQASAKKLTYLSSDF